jgi:(p)ppGpp synthase/HD superfamily hydrolase
MAARKDEQFFQNNNNFMNKKVIDAMSLAMLSHDNTNHSYNGNPYALHLSMVVHYAMKYMYLIAEEDEDDVIAACWLHDTIEDCRLTYNDVKNRTNEKVADIVYALTNEKGKNRAERGNENYYKGIRETSNAVFVKLCDRLANVNYSAYSGSRMLEMYAKENVKFLENLGLENDYGGLPIGIASMVNELKWLLDTHSGTRYGTDGLAGYSRRE